MNFKTSITKLVDGQEEIRGHKLDKLIQENGFVAAIYLLTKGELPDEKEKKMFEALLTAAIDHGPGTASGMTSRITASADNSLHTSVASGILAMGEKHGSAIKGAMKFFYDNGGSEDVEQLVKQRKESGDYIPGYGHPELDQDKRSQTLFDLAEELGFYGKYCRFAEDIREELNNSSSTTIPLNIDGAMAAILCELGFDWKIAKGIFIIARVPGLVAQVFEEKEQGGSIKRLGEDEIEYK
ncbi:MAG: citryl-CoA lyase [Candidatus Magasanikbacteria bacterium]